MELIRIKGLKGATKREGRSTAEGLVAAAVDNGVGVMVEVNCETDFVAKAAPFIEFSKKVLDTAVSSGAADVETLLAVDVDGKPMSEVVIEAGALLGEKVAIRRLARVEGAAVDAYLHKTSKDLPAQVGVLFAVDTDNQEVAHERRGCAHCCNVPDVPHP
jgi:elongation factor Ts